MSQRKKKEDDKDKDSGLGTTLAAGAAVVGVAALAYGAWKLYDFFANNPEEGASSGPVPMKSGVKPPKKVCDSSEDDDDFVQAPSRRDDNLRERNDSSTTKLTPTAPKPEMSLSALLLDYYQKYVEMNPMDFREAVTIVKDLKMQIAHCVRTNGKLRSLRAVEVRGTGGYADGLMVICPENFDLVMPFVVCTQDCIVSQADAKSELHSVVFEREENTWACRSGQCLDSKKVVDVLSDVLSEAVDSFMSLATTERKLKIEETKAVVEVHYANGLKKITINIVPALYIGDRSFVSDHLLDSTRGEEREGFCWRESFNNKEQERLDTFGTGVTSHRIILKIFKAVRLNFPLQFGILSSYHYLTILLRVLDDQPDPADWETSAISERFIDFLIELGNCLKERNLPHYFRPECNLLDQISPLASQNLAHFINRIVGHHDIASLLKYDYGSE